MKRYIFRFVILLILASVQFIIQPDWLPDFILIIVIYYSLRFGVMSGQLTGFFGGLIQDLIFNSQIVGVNILTKHLIGFVLGLMEKRIYHRSMLAITIITFFVAIFNAGLSYILELIFIPETKHISQMIKIWLIKIPLTAVFAPLFFWFLDKIEGKTEFEGVA